MIKAGSLAAEFATEVWLQPRITRSIEDGFLGLMVASSG